MIMATYAITGASGQLGRLAVQELLARGVSAADVVAVVRTRGKAADLAERGVQVRKADYTRPQTLGAALVGVDRLLLISSSEAGQRVAHHTNVVEAAKTAGTTRIVYTSMLNSDNTTNPLAGEHQDSERALRVSGVPFTLSAGRRLGSDEVGVPASVSGDEVRRKAGRAHWTVTDRGREDPLFTLDRTHDPHANVSRAHVCPLWRTRDSGAVFHRREPSDNSATGVTYPED